MPIEVSTNPKVLHSYQIQEDPFQHFHHWRKIGSTRDSQPSRKSFSQDSSNEFHVRESKSPESSGYSTIMDNSSLNPKTKTLSRKLPSSGLSSSNLSNCGSLDRSISLSNSFFQPPC